MTYETNIKGHIRMAVNAVKRDHIVGKIDNDEGQLATVTVKIDTKKHPSKTGDTVDIGFSFDSGFRVIGGGVELTRPDSLHVLGAQ